MVIRKVFFRRSYAVHNLTTMMIIAATLIALLSSCTAKSRACDTHACEIHVVVDGEGQLSTAEVGENSVGVGPLKVVWAR